MSHTAYWSNKKKSFISALKNLREIQLPPAMDESGLIAIGFSANNESIEKIKLVEKLLLNLQKMIYVLKCAPDNFFKGDEKKHFDFISGSCKSLLKLINAFFQAGDFAKQFNLYRDINRDFESLKLSRLESSDSACIEDIQETTNVTAAVSLPIEIWALIFRYLRLKTIIGLVTVSRAINKVVLHDAIWKEKYKQYFPAHFQDTQNQDTQNQDTQIQDIEIQDTQIQDNQNIWYPAFVNQYKKAFSKITANERNLISLCIEGELWTNDASWGALQHMLEQGMFNGEHPIFSVGHDANTQHFFNSSYRKVSDKTILWALVTRQSSQEIKRLIESERDQDQWTLFRTIDGLKLKIIHCAAMTGNLDVVTKQLVAHPESLNAVCEHEKKRNYTPLMFAVENGHYAVVAFLVAQPAIELNAESESRKTAFDLAVEREYMSIAKLLINAAPEVINLQQRTLHWLHRAALSGSLELVRLLVGKDALPLHINSYWGTPLTIAVRERTSFDVISYLVTHPAQAAISDWWREPLKAAIKKNLLEVVKLFISVVEDISSIEPLHIAARSGSKEVLQYLAGCFPALIYQTDKHKNTILHLAAHGKLEIVEWLVKSFPDLFNNQNTDKKTSFHVAAAHGHLNIVTFFSNTFPERINQVDGVGGTPLIYAARYGHEDVVEYLLQRPKINLNVVMQDGNISATALGWADICSHQYAYQRIVQKILRSVLQSEDTIESFNTTGLNLKIKAQINLAQDLVKNKLNLSFKHAKKLLEDYVSKNAFARFFTGHWNRHHVSEVSAILIKINSGAISTLDELLLALKSINLINPDGTLAHDIKCIEMKNHLMQAKKVLEDYTSRNSINRFFSGHWNRHHISEVNYIITNINLGSIHTINILLLELNEIKLVNGNGELARRIKFIKNKFDVDNRKINQPLP